MLQSTRDDTLLFKLSQSSHSLTTFFDLLMPDVDFLGIVDPACRDCRDGAIRDDLASIRISFAIVTTWVRTSKAKFSASCQYIDYHKSATHNITVVTPCKVIRYNLLIVSFDLVLCESARFDSPEVPRNNVWPC